MASGIYSIRCLSNGRIYVGQSRFIEKRKVQHYSMLRGGYHENAHLQRAFNKYGEEAFCFCVLEYADISDLDCIEMFWIKFFKSNDGVHGFNSESGGNKNKVLSAETRAKISARQIGRKQTPESIERRRISCTGKKRSAEFCKRVGDRRRGSVASSETLAKMSASRIGFKHTDETKEKMSVAHKSLVKSDEHRKNLSISLTGKKVSDSTRAKMSSLKKEYWARRKATGATP